MKKVLLAVLVFVVLSAGVGFWTLKNFDQTLRSEIIAAVSEKTGRSLVIDGKTETHFSGSPSVTISNVKLTNASWAAEPYMLQIDNLSVEAELMPLFNRQVKIKRFVLDGVHLNLEIDQDGKNNWMFLEEKTISAEKNQADQETPALVAQKKKLGFDIGNLIMQNVKVVLLDRQNNKTFNADLNTLDMMSGPDGLTMTSQWKIQGNEYSLSANADALSALFDAKAPYHFTAEINHPDLTVKTDGTIEHLLKETQISASVKADVADISVLSPFFGYNLPAVKNMIFTAQIAGTPDKLSMPTFDLSMGNPDAFFLKAAGNVASVNPFVSQTRVDIVAPDMKQFSGLPALPASKMTLQAKIDKGVALEDMNLTVGHSDLTGRILVHTDQNLAVYAGLHSNRLDLSELSRKFFVLPKPIAYSKKAVSKKRNSRIFSDKPLPFEQLKSANVNVTADVDNLIASDKTNLGKVALTALMQDGKFSLSKFNLANYVFAQAKFDASGKMASAAAELKFNNMPMKLFFAQQGVKRGTLNGNVRLNGSGVSQSALAAAINGKIFLNAKDVYFDSFVELPPFLSFLTPSDQTQPLTVSCAVVNVPIKNGVLMSDKKIGVENNIFDLQVDGNINLGTEKVDLKLVVSPRSDGILRSVFNSVSLVGPLSSPSVRVNAEQTLNRALSFGMTFFMGGKEAVQDMVRREALKNVCGEALATK